MPSEAPDPDLTATDLHRPRGLMAGSARLQAVVTVVVAGLSLLAGGWPAAVSALGGAAVAWVTTLYASWRASVPEQSAGAALRRVMVAEFINVLSTIVLFAAATRLPHVVWPALLCGYAAARVAFWVPMMTAGGRQEQRPV